MLRLETAKRHCERTLQRDNQPESKRGLEQYWNVAGDNRTLRSLKGWDKWNEIVNQIEFRMTNRIIGICLRHHQINRHLIERAYMLYEPKDFSVFFSRAGQISPSSSGKTSTIFVLQEIHVQPKQSRAQNVPEDHLPSTVAEN
jgi:hypothetical protein